MPEFELTELMLNKESFSANLRPEDARLLSELARDGLAADIKLLIVPKPAVRRVMSESDNPYKRPQGFQTQVDRDTFDEPRIFGTTMADNLAGPYQTKAMHIVRSYIMSQFDKSDEVTPFEIYVVWFCFILGGWKALISTDIQDGMYYEVTHDHHKACTYLDVYKKFYNTMIRD